MRRRIIDYKLLLVGVLGLCEFASSTALGGPATYDKSSKSFRFTYTFAALPGGVPGSVVGQVQKPRPDQEAVVKGLVGKVSDVLYQVTDGRAKIGQLDYVDDIKNADLVISLTGRPASPGWATQRAIGGKPGQIVLYYESLSAKGNVQDVVYTAAHEICHYVFGLADEYDPANFPGGCPPTQGAGCLMDNYNSGARGYLGRLCISADHNHRPTQQPSCKEIVDRFFDAQGVVPETPSSMASMFPGAGGASTLGPDPRTPVITSAIAKVKAKREQDLEAGRTSTSGLRRFAQPLLKDLVQDFNRDNPAKIILGGVEGQVLDRIVNASLSILPPKPTELPEAAFQRVRAEAERLGTQFQGTERESTRKSAIQRALLAFIKQVVEQYRVDRGFSPSDQRDMAEALAADVARSPEDRQRDQLLAITRTATQLNIDIAEDVIRILDAQGEPGVPIRRARLEDLKAALSSEFGIVGRDSTQFGLRRTRIIAPEPIGGDFPILTQGGVYSYDMIRDESIVQFSRLIDRSRIQLISPVASGGGAGSLALQARIEQPFGTLQASGPATPSAPVDIQDVLADTIEQINRDRLENIIILVPPGGLPSSVARAIPRIRSEFGAGLRSIRLDLVLVGAVDIAAEIRDAVVDSRGSVLTITDGDEIGAIAQRLKNEQSSGSWVIVPTPGTFKPDAAVVAQATDAMAPQTDDLIKALEKYQRAAIERSPDPGAPQTDRLIKQLEAKLAAVKRGPEPEATQTDQLIQALEVVKVYVASLGKFQFFGLVPADQIDPNVEAKRGEAVATLNELIRTLKVLREKSNSMPSNGDRSGQIPGAVGKDDRDQLLRGIEQAKVALSHAQRLSAQARGSTNPDPTAQILKDLSQLIDTTPKGSKADQAKDKQLPPKVKSAAEALGTDFRNVAKLLSDYEQILEKARVDAKEDVPIFRRIDREAIQAGRLSLDLAGIEAQTGLNTFARVSKPAHGERLARFYAEGNSRFELILGLSRALPLGEDGKSTVPRMVLVNDENVPVAGNSGIELDAAASTPALLVWRTDDLQPLPEGWYTPIVTFEAEVYKSLTDQRVNYTFSVGSSRPNVQVIPGLVQGADSASSGTLNRSDGPAVVEVQVSAGSAVLGANIGGFYQPIPNNSDDIPFRAVSFRDDGADFRGLPPHRPQPRQTAHRPRRQRRGLHDIHHAQRRDRPDRV